MKTVEIKITLEQLRELCTKRETLVELKSGLSAVGFGKPFLHIVVEDK